MVLNESDPQINRQGILGVGLSHRVWGLLSSNVLCFSLYSVSL